MSNPPSFLPTPCRVRAPVLVLVPAIWKASSQIPHLKSWLARACSAEGSGRIRKHVFEYVPRVDNLGQNVLAPRQLDVDQELFPVPPLKQQKLAPVFQLAPI